VAVPLAITGRGIWAAFFTKAIAAYLACLWVPLAATFPYSPSLWGAEWVAQLTEHPAGVFGIFV